VRVLVTVLISWLLALSIGMVLHKIKKIYSICLPGINFFRQISPFVWLPFAIILVGLGEVSIGMIMIVAMLFPGIVMVFETLDSFPRDVLEEAVTSGAGQVRILLHIELPMLWKQFINIFRILWSVGWSTIIAAEMLGVSRGLGFRLLDFRYLLEYRNMFVYIFVIGTIGIICDRFFRLLAKSR